MPEMNLPEENRTMESISKHVWISLTGPAVGSLKEAFFGPSVKVLQEYMGAKGVTTQAEEEECAANEAGRGEMIPSDTPRTTENIKSKTVSPIMIVMAGKTPVAQKYIKVQKMYRIVLLGDTRAGKSSLANTIFGEDVFKVDNTECQAESKSVHGRRITLINTPDFSGPGRSEEEVKPEILRCTTEFPPGPHAFLIVLKAEKSTEQQQQAFIQKICQYFSEEAFKYSAVVFTRDDQVSDGIRIKDFIDQNKCVSDLVKKCKSRFHIINNYKPQGDNISNQSQVAELLNTIEQIVEENKGRCYSSKMLPQGDTCSNANGLIKLTGPAAASVAKAFNGPAVVVLTQGMTNKAEKCSKITDEIEGLNEEEPASETVIRRHTEKLTTEDRKNEETKGGEEAKETEAHERRTDGNINEAEQDQQPKETEEEREEEATQKPAGELEKESQEKTERKEEDKHGVIHDARQEQGPKKTEQKKEDRSQEKILGHSQAAGGAATGVGALAAGTIVAAGAIAGAGTIAAAGIIAAAGNITAAGTIAGASSAGTAGGAAAEVATAAGSVAEGTGATAAGAGAATAGAGSAAGAGVGTAGSAAGYVAKTVIAIAIAAGGAIGLRWVIPTIRKAIKLVKLVKQNIGVILLVLVFYSLLLSWFFFKVPFVGTLFLLFLFLVILIVI